MASYKILGRDPYWMNFYGLMILTLIEVLAVGFELPRHLMSGAARGAVRVWAFAVSLLDLLDLT